MTQHLDHLSLHLLNLNSGLENSLHQLAGACLLQLLA
ncbi:hypothetical protein FBY06_104249 [Pseudomonas sp. SJZ085]|nr:hypothetical protein FBX99_10441 [Pseudomonas sp. SJZ074]TWC40632.1 hypothetical protein FBY06_104249 [Pseudomonas sp. SJZ085]